jgi:hypothetical protein
MEVATYVLLLKAKTSFELNLQKGNAIDVLCDEISTTPIAAESNGNESVVGKDCRDLLEVVALLLLRGSGLRMRRDGIRVPQYPLRNLTMCSAIGRETRISACIRRTSLSRAQASRPLQAIAGAAHNDDRRCVGDRSENTAGA